MRIADKGKLAIKIGATAGMMLGLGLAFQPAAGAATSDVAATSAASITVTPSTGLSDGTLATVSGTGLKPGAVYHVGECAAVLPTAYACNDDTNIDLVAGADGTATTPLVLRTIFTGAAGGSTWTVDCGSSACVVAVFDDTFDGGAVPISFN